MLPRLLRLKEWAYPGAVFLYTGAAASHILAGEGANRWSGPLVFALFTLGSWAVRPASRRLALGASSEKPSLRAWLVPSGALVVMTVIALATIPKGSPPV
jgi:hypothetical protein